MVQLSVEIGGLVIIGSPQQCILTIRRGSCGTDRLFPPLLQEIADAVGDFSGVGFQCEVAGVE
jgi:hypothetical protein